MKVRRGARRLRVALPSTMLLLLAQEKINTGAKDGASGYYFIDDGLFVCVFVCLVSCGDERRRKRMALFVKIQTVTE